MLRDIRETKVRNNDDAYECLLEISGKDFFNVYDRVDTEIAEDIVSSYLLTRGDDGRAEDIDINHNKNQNIIEIRYKLNYLDNDHTMQKYE